MIQVELGAVITGLSTLVLAFYAGLQLWQAGRWRRQEQYQKIELAAAELFRLSVEHPNLTKVYNRRTPIIVTDPSDWDKFGYEERQMREYISCLLQLFDLQYDLWSIRKIDDWQFTSWMPWLYNLCRSVYFRWAWTDLKKHYEASFRGFIDGLMSAIDGVSEDSKEAEFYKRAARLSRCTIIEKLGTAKA